MKTGTKSLLFGVHQFILHPLVVFIAWIVLYRKLPSWKELICIIIHDWGYWGKTNMDDEEGEKHPETAAKIAGKLFGHSYHDLCLYHSRHYARTAGQEPSLLCWADKQSILYDPWWFYLPRAWLSGELTEYRRLAANCGFVSILATHREWYRVCRNKFIKLAKEKKGNAVSYANNMRKDI